MLLDDKKSNFDQRQGMLEKGQVASDGSPLNRESMCVCIYIYIYVYIYIYEYIGNMDTSSSLAPSYPQGS